MEKRAQMEEKRGFYRPKRVAQRRNSIHDYGTLRIDHRRRLTESRESSNGKTERAGISFDEAPMAGGKLAETALEIKVTFGAVARDSFRDSEVKPMFTETMNQAEGLRVWLPERRKAADRRKLGPPAD
ncbi:glutamyl-tRNA(Gln) amidotransferase subunit A [Striga asiatica]|uniref:Glutamyl-tRNA(Gln) amidotransferase subunit A n=1 Tax=Striga asiatica TaxID=4170 RepID=A0A5A7Q514_STRAF|nr:glutamyl-tRNA(Gln) amidotransferase subunit A [Striga asiatica]